MLQQHDRVALLKLRRTPAIQSDSPGHHRDSTDGLCVHVRAIHIRRIGQRLEAAYPDLLCGREHATIIDSQRGN